MRNKRQLERHGLIIQPLGCPTFVCQICSGVVGGSELLIFDRQPTCQIDNFPPLICPGTPSGKVLCPQKPFHSDVLYAVRAHYSPWSICSCGGSFYGPRSLNTRTSPESLTPRTLQAVKRTAIGFRQNLGLLLTWDRC